MLLRAVSGVIGQQLFWINRLLVMLLAPKVLVIVAFARSPRVLVANGGKVIVRRGVNPCTEVGRLWVQIRYSGICTSFYRELFCGLIASWVYEADVNQI